VGILSEPLDTAHSTEAKIFHGAPQLTKY